MTRGATHHPHIPVLRCLGVWSLVTVLAAGGGALCLQAALSPGPGGWSSLTDPGRFEDLVVVAGGAVGVVSLLRLWLVASSTVVSLLRGRAPTSAHRGAVRRIVLLLCGAALATSVAGAAHAAAPPTSSGSSLAGLPYPDRASTPAEGAAASSGAPQAVPSPRSRRAPVDPVRLATPVDSTSHVVRHGDTLWSIAAATLPRGATPDEVEARWREIHRTNRHVIGDDPHLIHPGQDLSLPTTSQGDPS